MIELIYDDDCPHLSASRQRLREALTRAGLPSCWTEWDRKDPQAPGYVRSYGSPTVLVDGRDVAGSQPGTDSSADAGHCRIYADGSGGFEPLPPARRIAGALTAAGLTKAGRLRSKALAGRSLLATVPGSLISFLPVGLCPACWPVYTGLLSSLGLGFLLQAAYLAPLTIALLAVAVAGLGYGARARRGLAPFALGLAASILIVVGKFAGGGDAIAYLGIGLLIGAGLWNAWPRRVQRAASCPACKEPPDLQP